jgi:hypothetical protein
VAIPAIGPARRSWPIETRIGAEQVRLLLSLGEASRWTIFGGILIVGLVFLDTAPVWSLPAVMVIQFVAQFLFDRVRAGFHADPDAVPNAMKWAHRYALVTLISGATWGVGSILWLPESSFAHEIFYILVLATLVMATAVSRATYPPAVIYYTVAACLLFAPHDLERYGAAVLHAVASVSRPSRWLQAAAAPIAPQVPVVCHSA